MTGSEQHEEAPASATDDGGLFLVDQTFTPEAGEEARRRVEAERGHQQRDEPQGA